MTAPRQRKLPPAHLSASARDALARRLLPHLRRPLALTLTANRTTIIAVRREPDRLTARIHHMFSRAPDPIIRALAQYLETNERHASRLVGQFINGETHQDPSRRLRRMTRSLLPAGRHHDLAVRFESLNHRFFQGRVQARITWGSRPSRPRIRRSIKMGSYSVDDRIVRIHPALDRPFVPTFFLDWIIFHEMLHAVHRIPTIRGRRVFHTAEFLAHERTYPEYARAREWERRNLDRLLNY